MHVFCEKFHHMAAWQINQPQVQVSRRKEAIPVRPIVNKIRGVMAVHVKH